MIIAIDGPAASGKGTIAKGLAKHFGYAHIDSGTFYRAYPVFLENHGTDALCDKEFLEFTSKIDDIELRGEERAKMAALYAQDPEVRLFITESLRLTAARASSEFRGVVMDGRDIGTVVLPHADAKLFVTASAEERARRRHAEMTSRGVEVGYDVVLADIHARDARDTGRADAPLLRATDADLLDTGDLTIGGAVQRAIALVEARLSRRSM